MSEEETKNATEVVSDVQPKLPTDEQKESQTAVIEEEEEAKHKGQMIDVKDVRPGMTVRIHERIKDVSPKGEERERIQVFQGMVIGIRGSGLAKTMTIRRQHKGYGAEKIFPLKSPVIANVELVKTAKVRRAKLAHLQDLRHPFKRKLKETWVE